VKIVNAEIGARVCNLFSRSSANPLWCPRSDFVISDAIIDLFTCFAIYLRRQCKRCIIDASRQGARKIF